MNPLLVQKRTRLDEVGQFMVMTFALGRVNLGWDVRIPVMPG